MDNAQYLNIIARIEAIKAEIEAAKLDNYIRQQDGHTTFNYSVEWFNEKASELQGIAMEPYR